jgi:hypothetical protein
MHSATFRRHIQRGVRALLTGALLLSFSLPATGASSADPSDDAGQLLAQASEGGDDGKLEPRYQPREPEPKSSYNASYVFGLTRGVADSTIHPAVKAPIFVLTLPLDLVFLPFALIGGLFG